MHLLALDAGTSSSRAIVFDTEGEARALFASAEAQDAKTIAALGAYFARQ